MPETTTWWRTILKNQLGAVVASISVMLVLHVYLIGQHERRIADMMTVKASVTDVAVLSRSVLQLTDLVDTHLKTTLSADAWALFQKDIEQLKANQLEMLQRMARLEAVMRR